MSVWDLCGVNICGCCLLVPLLVRKPGLSLGVFLELVLISY